MATFCFQCVTSFFGMKKQRNLNYFQAQIWQRGLFLGPEFKFIKNFHVLTFHKIVFAHTKFGLVRIKGSGVKREADSTPPPGLSEFLKSRS